MNYGSRKKFRLKQRKKGFEISDIKKDYTQKLIERFLLCIEGKGEGGGVGVNISNPYLEQPTHMVRKNTYLE